MQLDARGAELLFQVLTELLERASVAVGSNLSFSEWAPIITAARLIAAAIDRLTFNAHIIETAPSPPGSAPPAHAKKTA